MAERVINLDKVLKKNRDELKSLKNCLVTRGWCFVDVPAKYMQSVDEAMKDAELFFKGSEEERNEYCFLPHYGYNSNTNKQGFRMLTGPYLERMPNPKLSFLSLGRDMDKLAKDILASTGQYLFDKDTSGMYGMVQSVPMVETNKTVENPFYHIARKFRDFGMLDIVQYTDKGKNVNVVEHIDPGLFSISLRSDEPGLQMLDKETNSWIDVPINQPVLWLGARGTMYNSHGFKAGTHRVTKIDSNRPRHTMWYEVCTFKQVHCNIVSDSGKFIRADKLAEEKLRIVKVKSGNVTHEFVVPINETTNCLFKELEKTDGIPMTKRLPSLMYNKEVLHAVPLSEIPENAVIEYR